MGTGISKTRSQSPFRQTPGAGEGSRRGGSAAAGAGVVPGVTHISTSIGSNPAPRTFRCGTFSHRSSRLA